MRRALHAAIFWLIVLAMCGLIAVIFLQVFFRYVLNDPLTWPEEVGRYLFVWIVFLGFPDAWRRGRHLGMDLITAQLPDGAKRVLARIVEAVVLVFSAVVAWTSLQLVQLTMSQTAPVTQIPIGLVYVSFTVGFALIVLETLVLWSGRTGEPLPGDIAFGLAQPPGGPDAHAPPSHN